VRGWCASAAQAALRTAPGAPVVTWSADPDEAAAESARRVFWLTAAPILWLSVAAFARAKR
jgi:hypothetical protein